MSEKGAGGAKARREIPKWESELWSHICHGNGINCPMYSRCQDRRNGGWCISRNRELIEQLLNSNHFNPANFDVAEYVTPCKIFKLVAMLAQSALRKGRVHHPPVPAELVYLADGQRPIKVRLVPLTSHHGAIWQLNDRWILQLNENDTPARQRLTLFHEAFHILAHCGGKATPVFRKIKCEAGSFNELLADCFAACVLMPEKWVEEKWAEVNDFDQMTKSFDVTEEAMWVRLKVLRLAGNLPPPRSCIPFH